MTKEESLKLFGNKILDLCTAQMKANDDICVCDIIMTVGYVFEALVAVHNEMHDNGHANVVIPESNMRH